MKTKKRLTKAERRIVILKDVLAQIKVEQYKVTTGIYVKLPSKLRSLSRTREGHETQAQTCLLNKSTTCKVCAKGAIFLSIVRKENKAKLNQLEDYNTRDRMSDALFGVSNLNRVEGAFEKWLHKGVDDENSKIQVYRPDYSEYYKTKKDEVLSKFVKKYPNKTERLVAIIKNMIKNDGVFTIK